jgi:hypothetical protein
MLFICKPQGIGKFFSGGVCSPILYYGTKARLKIAFDGDAGALDHAALE